MIILGFVIAFVLGFLIGGILVHASNILNTADLQIILLQVMDQLKKDKAEAKKDKKQNHVSLGKYLQADRTIQTIKELYWEFSKKSKRNGGKVIWKKM